MTPRRLFLSTVVLYAALLLAAPPSDGLPFKGDTTAVCGADIGSAQAMPVKRSDPADTPPRLKNRTRSQDLRKSIESVRDGGQVFTSAPTKDIFASERAALSDGTETDDTDTDAAAFEAEPSNPQPQSMRTEIPTEASTETDSLPTPYEAEAWVREAIAQNGILLPDGEVLRESDYALHIGVKEEDLILAAKVSYYEAGPSASEDAHRAVLCVIYNRCMATRFGGEVTDIPTEVYRSGQFSVIGNRNFKKLDPPEELVELARDIFERGNLFLPEDVLFFHAAFLGTNWGGRKMYGNIGGNLFFHGKTE